MPKTSVDKQADHEDARRIQDVAAYQPANRVPAATPPGGSSGAYTDVVGAVYATPSLETEKMAFKERLIEGDKDSAAQWMRTDKDVNTRYKMWKNAQVYDKDAFAMSLVDLREPGNAQWLGSVYPEYTQRRIGEINRQSHIWATLQRIKAFGINSREDLDLVYNIKAGRIGSQGAGDGAVTEYAPGFFANRGRALRAAQFTNAANTPARGYNNLSTEGFANGNVSGPATGADIRAGSGRFTPAAGG